MIIKHFINLETHIDENSDESAVQTILGMSEERRNQFFQLAAEKMFDDFLEIANEGNSWARLEIKRDHGRVAAGRK